MIYVLHISGGKDSAALWSWAKRTNLSPRIAVSQNTRWEAPGWRAYLRELQGVIGEPLVILDSEGFAERTRRNKTFPGRLNRRWCTQELKLQPAKEFHDGLRAIDDVTAVVGVRAEESDDRAKMPEREWSDFYDCEVWRPLIGWTLADVMREHHENGLPINPLYRLGSERVGCMPCIKAGKVELRVLGDNFPERVQEIRELEEETGNMMFCLEEPTVNGVRGKLVPVSIDKAIDWARTSRGGRQLPMFPEPSGCARWGLCEPPKRSADGT